MLKKILIGSAFIAVTAILVFGAIQRTSAKSLEDGLAQGRRAQSSETGWANPSEQGDHNALSDEVRGGGPGGSRGAMNNAAAQGRQENNSGRPVGNIEHPQEQLDLSSLVPGTLSQDEIDGLLYMVEEEQLARDVYFTMADLWGQATFSNIAGSEQTHMEEVQDLLEGYGLTAPENERGQFNHAELQVLYTQLVAQGSRSLTEALKVGAAIEEIDILDLRERVSQTDEQAIRTVYANLQSGSQNHLRSFTRILARKSGETYQPQYLSEADYQLILAGKNHEH